jgi:hypothetical protein
MELTLFINYPEIIQNLKKSNEEYKWGEFEKISSLLFKQIPDLELNYTILKNSNKTFELDNNNVELFLVEDNEKILPYFTKIIELYFEEFINKTLRYIVGLTDARFPISEKEFLEKYSYILEDIEKNIRRVNI